MPEPGIASENHMENVVWLALESLEPKYRILLYLYYYEGYSIRELTAILKRKESTLQTQLAAGRRKLKEELKKQGRFRKIGKGRENKMMSDPENGKKFSNIRLIRRHRIRNGKSRCGTGFRVQFQEEDRSGSRSYDPGGSHMAGKHLQRHWPEPV